MRLVYGTSNAAKLAHMRAMVADMGIEIVGLQDIEFTEKLPEIDESGRSPIENAKIKAFAYYEALSIPVFSCDTGLFLQGLPEQEQPGVHVRRRNGKTLTDEEMIEYYGNIATAHGGFIEGKYQNAICLILNKKMIFAYDGDDIAGEPFLISTTPHQKRIKGFPLDSLAVEKESGQYYFDIAQADEENERHIAEGFREFFKHALTVYQEVK